MSKFRNGDNDKRIVRNDPTRLIRKARPNAVQPTVAKAGSDAPTMKINPESSVHKAAAAAPETPSNEAPEFMNLDPGKTRVFKPKKAQAEELASEASDNPVVGWLVVVEGSGQGRAIEFSYGQQSIGRDASQSIQLDFGDEQISREHHAFIEYDPRERKVYLSKGANLVYHNGARVGQGDEVVLTSGDTIELGDTKLRFVTFCDTDFCWMQV